MKNDSTERVDVSPWLLASTLLSAITDTELFLPERQEEILKLRLQRAIERGDIWLTRFYGRKLNKNDRVMFYTARGRQVLRSVQARVRRLEQQAVTVKTDG